MRFVSRVRTWRVAHLYSEIALSRKPFGIGRMYTHNFSLGMIDAVTSQNIDISSWDTLYNSGPEAIYLNSDEVLKQNAL
jgi:hypothetical protein